MPDCECFGPATPGVTCGEWCPPKLKIPATCDGGWLASLAPIGHADALSTGYVSNLPVWECRVCYRQTHCLEGARLEAGADEWQDRGNVYAADRYRAMWHGHAAKCLVCSATQTLIAEGWLP
jgi:hypothetical protein